jgi:hypothetical protein
MIAQLLALSSMESGTALVRGADRMIAPASAPAQIETNAVRVSSPEGILWQGSLRVSPNQGASYQQNFSEAAPDVCPPGSPYDRSERRNISFNVYSQNSSQPGLYQIDASWGRPIRGQGCSGSGTRTVQVNKTLTLQPGETAVVEGDAGLRIEVTRRL